MGRGRRKYKKWHGFKKIRLSKNAKMWLILIGVCLIMLAISWIAKIDILASIALGTAFTAPVFLVRHQYPDLCGINKGLYKFFIYAYVFIWWSIILLPWAKIRWLLAVAYVLVCGIYLVYKIPEIKRESEFDCDVGILCIVEGLMFISTFSIWYTTETNTLGWIITVILSVIPILIASYYIWRGNIKIYKKILYSILAVAISLVYSWMLTVGFNAALDFSKPTEYKTMIKEKDYSSGKGRTRYSFTAYINGKLVDINVAHSIYEKYSEGSAIAVNIHKGALGMTYYTIDE